jgi:acetyl-CoA C-acetyltransferase
MKMPEKISVISAVRTPFGRFGGKLKTIDVYDLGAVAMKAAVGKTGIAADKVDEVWWGCGDTTNCKDPFTPVVARQSLLKAGLRDTTPSVTIDKACVSGMSAAYYGAGRILLGEAEIVLTGGVGSFSTVPYLARNLRWQGVKSGGVSLEDPLFPLGYKDYNPVAIDSGNVAAAYGVTRAQQDEFALASHEKYGRAHRSGFYADCLIPMNIEVKTGKKTETLHLDIDEQYRSDITLEDLTKLKTIFGNPTITAGNAPGLNDGATAQILMKKSAAESLGITSLYTILDMCSIAAAPELLPVAPALAIKKCLSELNMSLEEVDILEINEAFAAVPLVSCKLLACSDFMKDDYEHAVANIAHYPLDSLNQATYDRLLKNLNVNGGAVAVGHVNCASGARIMINAGLELRRRGGGIAVCAICGGLTQGDACVLHV